MRLVNLDDAQSQYLAPQYSRWIGEMPRLARWRLSLSKRLDPSSLTLGTAPCATFSPLGSAARLVAHGAAPNDRRFRSQEARDDRDSNSWHPLWDSWHPSVSLRAHLRGRRGTRLHRGDGCPSDPVPVPGRHSCASGCRESVGAFRFERRGPRSDRPTLQGLGGKPTRRRVHGSISRSLSVEPVRPSWWDSVRRWAAWPFRRGHRPNIGPCRRRVVHTSGDFQQQRPRRCRPVAMLA